MSAGTIEQVAPPAEPAGIVLHGFSWEFYERFLDEIEEKSRVRLIYDDGEPEVWRFRIDGLTLHVLSCQQFLQVTESPHFPGIHVDELNRFLRSVTTEEGNAWIRGVRQWVREQISGQQP